MEKQLLVENLSSSQRTCDYTHTFNGPFSGTSRVSQYQKGKNQSGFY